MTLPPTASIITRIGKCALVSVLVATGASTTALAASPDPAPQPTSPAARGSAPPAQPQPAPQAAAPSRTPGANQPLAGGSSSPSLTLLPAPSSEAAVPARPVTQPFRPARSPAVRTPGPSRPRAGHGRVRAQSTVTGAGIQRAATTAALALAGVRDLLRFPPATALKAPDSRHDGLLLLLSSLALGTLVLASLALLRRAARLRAEMWDGLAR